MQEYVICIAEQIDSYWSVWFDNFTLSSNESGNTLLTGTIADQAALHGTLTKIHHLGLTLLAVNSVKDGHENSTR